MTDLKTKDDRLLRDRKVCDIDGEACQRIVFDIGESNRCVYGPGNEYKTV